MDNLKKYESINDYTIVLCTRDYRKLGQISEIKCDSINFTEHLNSANEFSFAVYKTTFLISERKNFTNVLSNEEYKTYKLYKEWLWNNIVDHRLIWVKELNEYYEISVSLNDGQEVVKTITAKGLCETELSNYILDGLEINSEDDIARDDYEPTTFCNFEKPSSSLLHRALKDKAPNYTIDHVDSSLMKLQRTFSVSRGTDIYSFLTGDVADQFNCLFVFDSAKRSVSAYDLYTTCLECGHRGDFISKCPKCGNENLKHMNYFGEDTTIFVDKENLTDEIDFSSNADEVKNCLKMVAGDDLMTSTVRLLNQNGSDYLYYISDFQMNDMPKELVEKLKQYEVDYASYTEEYQKLVSNFYKYTDDILYLQSGMMPDVTYPETNATTEAKKIEDQFTSATEDNTLGLAKVTSSTSSETVNIALKNYIKIFIKSGYVKAEPTGTFSYSGIKEKENPNDKDISYGYWKGTFTVTNYSNEDDVVITKELTILVHDNYEEFVKQKILKELSKESDEDSVFDVLAIKDLKFFKNALTEYSYNRLVSFHDAIQSALDVLIQINQASEQAELYEALYVPYYEKLVASQNEMDKRQAEIDEKQKLLDDVNTSILSIQNTLNFKNYLGEDLYNIYCAYRREDVYENSNYISDGLTNAELIDRAKEFIETANNELVKSAEPQYTISSTLYNLLRIKEFEPIVDKFKLGNWIRVKIDGTIYRLRLVDISYSTGDTSKINVEFSTVSKAQNLVSDIQQIVQSAKSMSTNFSYVAKQAGKGNTAKSDVDDWLNNGLNSAMINVRNSDDSMLMNENGILCRYLDEDTGEYSPKQLRIFHNGIVLTKDNWQTVSQAIGEHTYTIYNPNTNDTENYTGYGVSADFLTSLYITGKTLIGGRIYSSNYSDGTHNKDKAGSTLNLDDGTFDFAAGGLRYDGNRLIISSKTIGDSLENVDVTAENLHIKAGNIDGGINLSQIDGTKDNKIQPEQISKINSNQIDGKIDASKIDGKIVSSQIESISSSQINSTIQSSQIENSLTNKKITNSTFSGDIDCENGTINNLTVNAITTSNKSGITQDVVIGDTTLRFVNGICVQVI